MPPLSSSERQMHLESVSLVMLTENVTDLNWEMVSETAIWLGGTMQPPHIYGCVRISFYKEGGA